MNSIGRQIKSLREDASITQAQLGKRAGCSGQVISNIKGGYTSPAVGLLERLADSLGASSDFLMDNITQYDIKLSDEEKELMLRYRRMTPKEKKLFLGVLDVTLGEN